MMNLKVFFTLHTCQTASNSKKTSLAENELHGCGREEKNSIDETGSAIFYMTLYGDVTIAVPAMQVSCVKKLKWN